MEANNSRPPPSAWRANRRIRATAWTPSTLSGEVHLCRTLARAGDLAPDDTSPSWSFHLGLPESLGEPRATHLASGYVLEFPHLADPPRMACLAIDRGIYAGSTSLELRPTLFSPGTEVEEDGQDQWLHLPNQTVLLRVKSGNEGTRFVLCVGGRTDEALHQAAESAFETELEGWVAEEFALRSAYWETPETIDGDRGLLADAMEEVVFQLEAPIDGYPHRWSAAHIPTARRVDVNQLYPLVQTWLKFDRSIARELVAGVLSSVQADGFLPASFVPGRQSSGSSAAAWPYLARAVLAIADSELSDRAREPLDRYLHWCAVHYNPSHTGMMCWRSADEALIPDTFDDQIASPALSAFLLAELDALQEIAGELDGDLSDVQERIKAQLGSSLWSDEHRIYRDRYLSGSISSRDTLAGLIPLVWSGLPETRRADLLERITSTVDFGDPDGVPQWQEWENDPAPPSISAGHQLLLLDALQSDSEQSTLHNLQDRVAGAILRHISIRPSFPTQLRASAQPADPSAAEVQEGIQAPVIGACLALAVLPDVNRRSGGESTSQFWLTLDRHRLTIMASVVGTIALLVVGSALNLARKPTAREDTPPQTTGLVSELVRQGKFAEALELLNESPVDGEQDTTLRLTRANIIFRMGNYDEAEKEYRAMIEQNFKVPTASLNLALTLFKKGQYDEAALAYDRCREQYASSHPKIAERAQEAARFIRLYRDTLVPQK